MRDNSICLPTLKKVKIENYSLYNQNIEFDFIDGINLVIGGNGVGKTTFIDIIKYALIGLYKKDLTVRNYGGEKRFFRNSYSNCNTYFRTRMSGKSTDEQALVELTFYVGKVFFCVRRSLYDTKLLSAYYIENEQKNIIEGETIRQDYYSKYENATDNEKEKYVQFNYEKILAEKINVSDFNDVIFLVNQILLFNESRNTILWKEDVQNRLFSNYLNDPDLETKRKDLQFESKYQDSIARHKQEEIKAITKVIKEIEKKESGDFKSFDKVKIINQIENLQRKLDAIKSSRDDLQKKVKELYHEVALYSKMINEKEKEKNKYEFENNKNFWVGVNPKYNVYQQQLSENHICPMCNAVVGINRQIETGKCFFCYSDINIDRGYIKAIDEVKIKLDELMKKRQDVENIIVKYEDELTKLDSEFRKTKTDIFEKQNELRSYEEEENDPTKNESAYIAMQKRIDELQQEKIKAANLSENYKQECINIISQIEDNMLEMTKNISQLFSDFAEAFLHVKSFLTLDLGESKKTKMFYPVIDGKIRYEEEELSESQRFFVDYSFRMSIMAYFYNYPAFYICETPDSSLDISYEENAVNTFMKFLEKPNSLILTSNLNNSTFIKKLLEKKNKINVINLLKYGKISHVQETNKVLLGLSEEIEVIVNAEIS